MEIKSKRIEIYIKEEGLILEIPDPKNFFTFNSKGELEGIENIYLKIDEDNAKILFTTLSKYFDYLKTGILPEPIN